MAAPTRANIHYYKGANAAPTNDTDPIGGAIDTAAQLNPATPSNLWANITIGTSDVDYYSVHYRQAKNSSSGSLESARFYNRAGARLNTSAGTATIVSTSSSENIQIKIVGKVGGNWDSETLTISGTTPAIGSKTWDNGQVWRWEAVSGTPAGNLTCSVNSYVCCVMYGSLDNPSDGDPESIACYMCSAETTWALATATDATVSASNRLTAPGSISSFSAATLWSGADSSIAVPGGDLDIDEYIGIVGKLTIKANIPQPLRPFQVMPTIIGDSTS